MAGTGGASKVDKANYTEKKVNAFLILASAAMALAVISSISSAVVSDVNENMLYRMLCRIDVGLFLALILFPASLFFASKGSYRANLIIIGLLSYPIYALYREISFSGEHFFKLLFVPSASCALYAIIIGMNVTKGRLPHIDKDHSWLLKAVTLFFTITIISYLFGFGLWSYSSRYVYREGLRNPFFFLNTFPFVHLWISEFIINVGILFPVYIYTIILFLKRSDYGFVLAPILIISTIMAFLSITTLPGLTLPLWLVLVIAYAFLCVVLIIPLMRALRIKNGVYRRGD